MGMSLGLHQGYCQLGLVRYPAKVIQAIAMAAICLCHQGTQIPIATMLGISGGELLTQIFSILQLVFTQALPSPFSSLVRGKVERIFFHMADT